MSVFIGRRWRIVILGCALAVLSAIPPLVTESFALDEAADVEPLASEVDLGSGTASLAGRVTDPEDQPLADITVVLASDSLVDIAAASTDELGGYSFSGIGPGIYQLRFEDPTGTYAAQWWEQAHAAAASTWIDLIDSQMLTDLDAVLVVAGSISGSVIDELGDPVTGALIDVYDANHVLVASAIASVGGSYTAGGLAPGEHVVEFRDESGSYLSEWFEDQADFFSATRVTVAEGTDTSGVDAVLAEAALLSGVVTDGAGSPIEGVSVTIYDRDYGWVGSRSTGSDGSFSLGGLVSGEYRVEFRDHSGSYLPEWFDGQPDFASATPVLVAEGSETPDVDVVMTTAGSISGVVIDGVSDPVSGIAISVYDADFGWAGGASTGIDGTYVVAGLTTADYRLHFNDYSATYLAEWFDDQPDFGSATPVAVFEGTSTADVDAILARAPAGSISGVVTNEAGDPLEAMSVVVFDTASGFGVASTMSVADGSFSVGGMASGEYRVSFRDPTGEYSLNWFDDQPDFASAASVFVTDGSDTPGVDAVLSVAGSISGSVSDSLGSPVEGVSVTVYDSGNRWAGSGSTGIDGSFTVGGLRAGDYRVEFRDPVGVYSPEWFDDQPDFASATSVLVAAGSDTSNVDAVLSVAGSITGVVTDGSGSPIKGISVAVYDGDYEWAGSGTTAVDGTFTVGGLLAGEYRVEFSDYSGTYPTEWYDRQSSFAFATPVLVSLGSETAGVDAALAGTGSISGMVTDESGAPIEGVRVTARDTSCSSGTGTVSGVDGSYRIGGLSAAEYRVEFGFDGGGFLGEWWDDQDDCAGATPVVVAVGSDASGVDAVLAAAGAVSGVVTDESGAPIDGVWVTAWDSACLNGQGAYTGVDGSYRIGGLSAAEYRVEFRSVGGGFLGEWWDDQDDCAGATPVVVAVGSDASGVDAVLSTVGSISGVVTDVGGDPIEGVRVTAWDTSCRHGTGTVSGVDGSYRIGGLSAAEYRVEFRSVGGGFLGEWWDDQDDCAGATPVVVAVGSDAWVLDAVLAAAGSISGVVTDESGSPIAGVRVFVRSDLVTGGGSALTSTDGTYTVGGLRSGEYRVEFSGDEYLAEWFDDQRGFDSATPVEVAEGTTTSGIDAVLSSGGSISGAVTDAEGGPVGNIQVRVLNASCSLVRTAYTDINGSYRIAGLSTAQYLVGFVDDAGAYVEEWWDNQTDCYDATLLAVVEGETVDDIDAVLQAAGSISGSVTNTSGSPIEGTWVRVYDAGHRHVGSTATDNAGAYGIGGLAAGEYRVVFDGPGTYLDEWFDDQPNLDTATPVSVEGGAETSDVSAVLATAGVVRGTVADVDGNPIPSASIRFVSVDTGATHLFSADEAGRYAVSGLPAGDYQIEFSDVGKHYPIWWNDTTDRANADIVTISAETVLDGIDAALVPAGWIGGTLTDSSGAPVRARIVVADTSGTSLTVYSDSDGEYVAGPLRSGDYTLLFGSRPTFIPEYYVDAVDSVLAQKVAVLDGRGTVDIDASLARYGAITGVVTDAHGDPIFGVSVKAGAQSDDTDHLGRYRIEGLVTGAYTVRFVAVGSYLLEYFDDQLESSLATSIEVVVDETVSGIDATLTTGGRITGSVENAVGEPVAGVEVSLWTSSRRATSFTNSNGSYVFSLLHPDDYALRFLDPSGMYLAEWYDDAASIGDADRIAVARDESVTDIDVTLDTGRIHGTVTGNAGVGLADIVIEVHTTDAMVGEWTTAVDGSFELAGVTAGTYWLRFVDDGRTYATEWFDDATSRDESTPIEFAAGSEFDIEVSLSARGSLTGTVVAANGDPIEGVTVWAYGEDNSYDYGEATTGADGGYAIASLDAGAYVVEFDDPSDRYVGEYYDDASTWSDASWVTVLPEAAAVADAELTAYGMITGTVVDPFGDPVEGITVQAYPTGTSSTTGADGSYLLAGLTSGDYQLRYTDHDGRYPDKWYEDATSRSEADLVPVVIGSETTGIDVMFDHGGSITGRVTDSTGAALTGIEVSASYGEPRPTDQYGYFTIVGLAAGEYDIQFSDPDGEYAAQWFNNRASASLADAVSVALGEETAGIDATLNRYAQIEGTVTDRSGTPLSGMLVRGFNDVCCFGSPQDVTGEDGHFVLSGVTAGSWTVVAEDPSDFYLEQWWNGQADEASATAIPVTWGGVVGSIDFALVQSGSLSGAVTTEDGVPLNGVRVAARPVPAGPSHSSYTDALGRYRVQGLSAGQYVVSFGPYQEYSVEYFDGQRTVESADRVKVEVAEDTPGINASLLPLGSVSGNVTNQSGEPLSGISVSAYRPGQDGQPQWAGGVETNPVGDFVLKGLTDGTYFIWFDGGEGFTDEWYDDTTDQALAMPILVSTDTVVEGIDAVLAGSGMIAGLVSDPDSAPVAGITVTLIDDRAHMFDTTTDDTGRYEVGGLQPGSYLVRYEDPVGRYVTEWFDNRTSQTSADEVILAAGESRTVDVVLDREAGAITGTVVAAGDSAPLEGIEVTILRGFSLVDRVTSSTDGAYEVDGLPPGEYTVMFSDPSLAHATQWYSAADRAQSAQSLSVDYGSVIGDIDAEMELRGAITGVVWSESGAPLANIEVMSFESGPSFRESDSAVTDVVGRFSLEPDTLGSHIVRARDLSGLGYLTEYFQDSDRDSAAEIVLSPGSDTGPLMFVLDSNHAPTASLHADRLAGYGPLDVQFDVEATDPDGDALSYRISFGDGASIEGSVPDAVAHTFSGVGTYVVRLEVIDGLSRDVDFATIEVLEAQDLLAYAGGDRLAVAGVPLPFNGGGSSPLAVIDDFDWDFGDGTSATGQAVSHTFDEPGDYTVTLTVVAGAEVATDEFLVAVGESGSGTGLEVLVTDDHGAPISGALVSVDLGGERSALGSADATGTARLVGLADGTYTVAAASAGFLPGTAQGVVAGGSGATTIQLAEGELAGATLTAEAATIDELIAAGIDPSDPANQNAIAFEIRLASGTTVRAYSRSTGEFIGAYGATYECAADGCSISFSDENGSHNATVTRSGDTFAVLAVPGTASWLKEFFTVELAILNNAAEDFTFSGGTATLRLPDGLVLAPTASPQTLSVPMSDVPGGSSVATSWIVRGDTEGEFSPSARYTASLEPTGLPVDVTATVNAPLKVWGSSAVELIIEADDEGHNLVPYRLRVGLKNVADVPLYNVGLSLEDDPELSFLYQPLQTGLDVRTDLLAPGSVLWTDQLVLIPVDAPGPFGPNDIGLADAVRVDVEGDVPLPSTFISMPAAAALGLEAGPTENQIPLDWEPVEGAVSYSLYEAEWDGVPGDSRYTWSLIESFPATATAAVVDDLTPDEPALYALVTTTAAESRVVHEAVFDQGLVVPCGDRGHWSGFLWSGPTPELSPSNCSVIEGEKTVAWEAESAVAPVEFETSIAGEGSVSCVPETAGSVTRIECRVLPPTEGEATLEVTATDGVGSTTRTYTLIPFRLDYVLMGDSYASGVGTESLPRIDEVLDPCYRSANAYGYRLFDEHLSGGRAALTFAACGGAVTADIANGQEFAPDLEQERDQWAIDPAADRPQIESLDESTDLVTISIGGNDFGFSSLAVFCASELDCVTELFDVGGGANPLVNNLDRVRWDVFETLRDVREAAPNASIFVVGYPMLFGDWDAANAASCPAYALGFSPVEVQYLRTLNIALNRAIGEAAQAAGVHFIDLAEYADVGDASRGVCSKEAYIVPPRLDLGPEITSNPLHILGLLSPISWDAHLNGANMLHPNADGHAAYLDVLLEAGITELPPNPSPTGVVGPPSDSETFQIGFVRRLGLAFFHNDDYYDPNEGELVAALPASTVFTCVATDLVSGIPNGYRCEIGIRIRNLEPGSEWSVAMYSTPVELASGVAGPDGAVSIDSITLPPDFLPGRHTVSITAVGASSTTKLFGDVVLEFDQTVAAQDDSAIAYESDQVTIDVLANDDTSGLGLDATSVELVAGPTSGSAAIGSGGAVEFLAGPPGQTYFAYRVCDLNGYCDLAGVTVTVVPAPEPPNAEDDAARLSEDTVSLVDVLANDSDPDDKLDPDTLAVVDQARNGTASVVAGQIEFRPDADWFGDDSVTYGICNEAGLCDTAVLALTVVAVNDRPVAADDSVSTVEDTAIDIEVLANDRDVDDDSLVVGGFSLPSSGEVEAGADGTLLYTPAPGFSGVDLFTYDACDPGGLCDTAQVTVTVDAVNDGPVRVNIDVWPGTAVNRIDPESRSAVAVAILGSSELDVEDVNVDSVRFGATGTEAKALNPEPTRRFRLWIWRLLYLKDVNRDGFTDLILHFRQSWTGLVEGDNTAVLSGVLDDGTMIEGGDAVTIREARRSPWHWLR